MGSMVRGHGRGSLYYLCSPVLDVWVCLGSALAEENGGKGSPNYAIATFHTVLHGLGWVEGIAG